MSEPLQLQPFKKQKLADIGVLQSAPPLWELSDYMTTEASAMNQGGEYKRNFTMEGEVAQLDEAALRMNYLQATMNGHKNTDKFTPSNKFVNPGQETGYVIPEAHYLSTVAEARNGYRRVDMEVRMLMGQNKRLMGDERTARDKGLENFGNAAKIEPAPLGISYAVEPNVPTTCLEHINDELVEPISAYVS